MENKIYKVCPFEYQLFGACIYLSKNSYLKISPSEGNYIVSYCYHSLLYPYCLETCPIGYEEKISNSKKFCYFCLDDENESYFLVIGKKCIKKCESPSILNPETKFCFNCQDDGLIYYRNTCIKDCSEVFSEYNEENNECINCKDLGKYFYEKECVDECPYGLVINSLTNECINCQDQDYYF